MRQADTCTSQGRVHASTSQDRRTSQARRNAEHTSWYERFHRGGAADKNNSLGIWECRLSQFSDNNALDSWRRRMRICGANTEKGRANTDKCRAQTVAANSQRFDEDGITVGRPRLLVDQIEGRPLERRSLEARPLYSKKDEADAGYPGGQDAPRGSSTPVAQREKTGDLKTRSDPMFSPSRLRCLGNKDEAACKITELEARIEKLTRQVYYARRERQESIQRHAQTVDTLRLVYAHMQQVPVEGGFKRGSGFAKNVLGEKDGARGKKDSAQGMKDSVAQKVRRRFWKSTTGCSPMNLYT